jgi:hypothetical protein
VGRLPSYHTTSNQEGLGPLPAWVALPGAYIPTSITLRVTRIHKPPHHIKVLVNEDEEVNKFNFLGYYTSHLEKEYINHKIERFNYSQTSVHELNSFLKVVHKPKLFSP